MELIYGNHTFRVQECVTGGIIWNIGRHNFPFEGYVPICSTGRNGNPDWVYTDSLRAFNMGDERLALLLLDLASRDRLPSSVINPLLKDYQAKCEYLMRYLEKIERVEKLMSLVGEWTKRRNWLLSIKWKMQDDVLAELNSKYHYLHRK